MCVNVLLHHASETAKRRLSVRIIRENVERHKNYVRRKSSKDAILNVSKILEFVYAKGTISTETYVYIH